MPTSSLHVGTLTGLSLYRCCAHCYSISELCVQPLWAMGGTTVIQISHSRMSISQPFLLCILTSCGSSCYRHLWQKKLLDALTHRYNDKIFGVGLIYFSTKIILLKKSREFLALVGDLTPMHHLLNSARNPWGDDRCLSGFFIWRERWHSCLGGQDGFSILPPKYWPWWHFQGHNDLGIIGHPEQIGSE